MSNRIPKSDFQSIGKTNNNVDALLDEQTATGPIAYYASQGKSGETMKKNNANNNFDFTKTIQNASIGLGVASGISNYGSVRSDYNSTLSSMKEAINTLTDTKTDIASSLMQNTESLKSDLSENLSINASGLLSRNKSDLMALENTASDFASGVIGNAKSSALNQINKTLQATMKNQQMRMNNLLEQNVDSARATANRISADIKNINTEIKKVEKAKSQQGLNLLKDFAGYASNLVDPSGTTQKLIQSTKYKNEYT